MMRPFTCLCMLAAAGAGLYLYQEKYRAQLLDRDIAGVIKQIDQSHDRINLLKAEWALLNEPERLASLAAQHLTLQPLAPTQFVRLADLDSRLPPPAAPDATPAPSTAPVAEAAPAPAAPEVAALPPPTEAPAQQVAAASRPAAPKGATVVAALATRPAAPVHPAAAPEPVAVAARPAAAEPAPQSPSVQMAAARPAVHRPPVRKPARQEEQLAAAETPRPYRPLYAPVMSAFASGAAAQAIHPPTLQRTAAGFTEPASPYVGSALGMAGSTLAAPVPINAGR
jgi:hypothetical protein